MSRSATPVEFEQIERRIRASGAVLDMTLTESLYARLLLEQCRDGVDVTHDVAYGPDAKHRLDIYRPHSSLTSNPSWLVFLHGGGFIRGDKSDRENMGQYFARHGFHVAVPNYRLAPQHRWPAGAEDVATVCRWLRDNGARHGGGPMEHLFLMGESAGAAHVAAATLVRELQPAEGLAVSGAVLISGVYNPRLEYLARRQFGAPTPDTRNEAYYGSGFAHYAAMSTVELIDASPFPLLITYAELDLLQMQVQAGELFARLVTRHGFSPELQVIPGHNHLTQSYAVNTGDEALTAPVLKFLRDLQAKSAADGVLHAISAP